MSSLVNLKEHSAAELHTRLAALGVTPALARRLQASVLRYGRLPTGRTDVSPRVWQRVREASEIPVLTRVAKVVSPRDGFAKYRFLGAGPEPFETVRIPLLHRPGDPKYVVCVSAQVGCALGCAFCHTGRLGWRRDLAAWEMVDQVIQVRDDSPHPVRGVVFMGMGEPFLNYDAVLRAAQLMAEPSGLAIAAKAITISTVGVVPAIRRYTAERQPYRLVVSLTAADSAQRRALLPIERRYPLPELRQALRERQAAVGGRITLAWTMIAGVNTRPADAAQLAAWVGDLPVKLDLIDVNDPSGRFRPPAREELDRFRDALSAALGAPVARRYSGGADIGAACGLLTGHDAG